MKVGVMQIGIYLLLSAKSALAQSPLGDAQDVGLPDVRADENKIADAIGILLFITGALSIIFIIIGGIMFITSSGNPDQTKRARTTLIYAVVGLLVSILAFAIINFVTSRLA